MSTSNSSSTNGRSRLWTAVPFLILLLGVLELALLIVIGVKTSLWWAVLIVVVGWIVGIALLVAAGQQSFVRLRSFVRALRGTGDVKDHLSRPLFTVLAAVCFFFPGLITDVIGIVLLLTPVQKRTVHSLGLGGGTQTAERVLYRRTNSGVIDGEIVVTPEPRPRPSSPHGDGPTN
jgi:UPF0716 protein FxsA